MGKRDDALAAGYKDEMCPDCGTAFPAEVHFIRCQRRACPMIGVVFKELFQADLADEPISALPE